MEERISGELLDLFLSEARELTEGIVASMMELEQHYDPETINTAFRMAHNLKGTSGTLGFGNISTLVHAIEDLLGKSRKEQTKPSSEEVSLILRATDKLMELIDAADPDRELDEETKEIIRNLKTLAGTNESQTTSPSQQKKAEQSTTKQPIKESNERTQHPSKNIDSSKQPESTQQQTKQTTTSPAQATEYVRLPRNKLDELLQKAEDLLELKLFIAGMLHSWNSFIQITDTVALHTMEITDELIVEDLQRAIPRLKDVSSQMQEIIKRAVSKQSEFEEEARHLSRSIDFFVEELRSLNLVPFSVIFSHLKRVVRDTAERTGKKANLIIRAPANIMVDRSIVEAVKTPLVHILRNAVDHGIEPPEEREAKGKPPVAMIRLNAMVQDNFLVVEVHDDGQGIDFDAIRRKSVERGLLSEEEANVANEERLVQMLFTPGFSTSQKITSISGRGVGLDVVKSAIESKGGRVHMDTIVGYGTSMRIEIPLSLESKNALLIDVSGWMFAVPIAYVRRVVRIPTSEIRQIEGAPVIQIEGQRLAVYMMSDLLGLKYSNNIDTTSEFTVLIVETSGYTGAVIVDAVLRETEVVVKPLEKMISGISAINGTSILPNGETVLVLSLPELIRHSADNTNMHRNLSLIGKHSTSSSNTVLVVDDSLATRMLESRMLESAGFNVITATNGEEALNILKREGANISIIVTDVQMPNIDGYELTKTIKSDPVLRDKPVVLLTSLDDKESIERGLESGADAYIVKQRLSKQELIRTINRLI